MSTGSIVRSASLFVLLVVLAAAGVPSAVAQSTGSITGVVVDAKNGESLPGANVSIQGTTTGTAADLNGRYRIANLQPGTYDVLFSFIGFAPKTVTGVEVTAGRAAKLDVSLREKTAELDEVIVEAEAARDSDAGLLKERAKAAALSNAISAEEIGRSGAGSVAEAMGKVTGATVVEGQYVNVRGLQGRYVNTQLNGVEIPSADPDGNSVSLDVIPANLLENISTIKTFTPDKPGNFTGGSIDIRTKSFPEDLTVAFSASSSVHSEVGLNGTMIQATGGLESVPDVVAEPFSLPSLVETYTNEDAARRADAAARAFREPAAPVQNKVLGNQSYDVSFGNQFTVFGDIPVGLLASGTFSNSYSGYESGTVARFQQTGQGSSELIPTARYTDQEGTQKAKYGGLLNLAVRPHPNHELAVNLVYNRQDEDEARFQQGRLPRDLTGDQIFQTRTLRTTQKTVRSGQMRGEHLLSGALDGVRLDWKAALSRSTQDDPDFRFFSNHLRISSAGDTTYTIAPSIYPVPARYFRDLEEGNRSGELNLTIPVWEGSIKLGGSYLDKTREFRERRFDHLSDQASYTGAPNAYINEQAGLIGEDSAGRNRFGTYLDDATQLSNNYDGDQTVSAGYLMADMSFSKIRLIAGARVEHTDMAVETLTIPGQNTDAQTGDFQTTDVLPSLNLVYEVRDDMNLRFAYGRTIARPSFREFAPFASFNFIGDYIEVGEPNLTRTRVNNLDLRWEWFVRPGELLSASVYYKRFNDPIERTINTEAAASNIEITYRNADYANVLGVEAEGQKRLDFLWDRLQYFNVGGNFSYIYSEVPIDEDELELIRAFDPDASSTRSLQGQSPYIVNLSAGYENPEWGTSLNVFFNRFGDRLQTASPNGVDLFERARSTVDILASQRLLLDGFRIKASVNNVLGADYEVSQAFRGEEFVNDQYPLGRTYSLGVKYEF